MAKKEKIPVNSQAAGLNQAFANLQMEGLPEPKIPMIKTEEQKPTPKMGRVVLRREKASRGGKTVIVVYDFESRINGKMIDELGRKLRNGCSCGGTTRDRTIEIQGDQP